MEAADESNFSQVSEALAEAPRPRPQLRSKAQSWGHLPQSHRGIMVGELWEFYNPKATWLEQMRWRCDVCHKSCSCEHCDPPQLSAASSDFLGEQIAAQMTSIVVDIENNLAAIDRRVRAVIGAETTHICSHCEREVKGRPEGRNLYEVVEEMVKPACAELRISYVELLRRLPGGGETDGVRPDTFVSHWWGEEFPKLVRTLTRFAEARTTRLPWSMCSQPYRNPKTWAVWICAFANNQYAIEHALGDFSTGLTPRTAVMTSAFATALEAVNDVVAVLDDRAIIYTRIWCCFELFSVERLIPERKQKKLEIFIADESGVVSSGCGNVNLMDSLIDQVKTSDASASNSEDKAMIESAMLAEGTTNEDLDAVLQKLANAGVSAAGHRRCLEVSAIVVMMEIIALNIISTCLDLTDSEEHFQERAALAKWWARLVTQCIFVGIICYFLVQARITALRLGGRDHRAVRLNERLAIVCFLFSLKLWLLSVIVSAAGHWGGIISCSYYIALVVLTICGRGPLRKVLDPVFL